MVVGYEMLRKFFTETKKVGRDCTSNSLFIIHPSRKAARNQRRIRTWMKRTKMMR